MPSNTRNAKKIRFLEVVYIQAAQIVLPERFYYFLFSVAQARNFSSSASKLKSVCVGFLVVTTTVPLFMFFQTFILLSKPFRPTDLILQQLNREVKGEVRRKMNFRYVLGFVVLRDVVKVFLVSSSSLRERRPGGIEHEVTRGHDAA